MEMVRSFGVGLALGEIIWEGFACGVFVSSLLVSQNPTIATNEIVRTRRPIVLNERI
jgi:hypothetical protein